MKKYFCVLACLITFSSLSGNIGPQGFGEFCQTYFVETGTFCGNGIQKALDAGFQQIRSIEFDNNFANHSKLRFAHYSNVKIYRGDSSVDLWNVIKDINQPITFWLDAHIYPPRTDGGKNCPLIEELDQIKRHPIKSHIILIDDMHCCGTASFDFMTHEDFINKLLEINPDYQIRYVDGGDAGEYKNNVMVAILENDE
jgi:hypothetical protein